MHIKQIQKYLAKIDNIVVLTMVAKIICLKQNELFFFRKKTLVHF